MRHVCLETSICCTPATDHRLKLHAACHATPTHGLLSLKCQWQKEAVFICSSFPSYGAIFLFATGIPMFCWVSAAVWLRSSSRSSSQSCQPFLPMFASSPQMQPDTFSAKTGICRIIYMVRPLTLALIWISERSTGLFYSGSQQHKDWRK